MEGHLARLIEPRHLQTLETPLASWLPAQRWFGGKGRIIRRVSVFDYALIEDDTPALLAILVDVRYAAGAAERYFLPLALSSQTGPASIGVLELEQARVAVTDGLLDPGCCRAFLAAIEGARRLPTFRAGEVVFTRLPTLDDLVPAEPIPTVRSFSAEQSNSSVVIDEALVLKCFRRVFDGPNPDLEVPRFLASRSTFDRLPKLAGAIEYSTAERADASLGILQQFVQNQGDGWNFTLRELQNSRDGLAASPGYLGAVRDLGWLTAELHLALASDPREPDFAPEPITASDLASWHVAIAERLDGALADLRRASAGLELAVQALARRALAGRDRLAARADDLAALRHCGISKTRYHGDYHLGQVLRTADGWLVLDFEGEPLRSLAERRAHHCPLKDVAGMLRSFNYARQTALRCTHRSPVDGLAGWEQSVRAAFLGAYFERAGPAPVFLPGDPRITSAVLRAFEVEKAAYELEYELNNRPDWVAIPLSYLADQ